ncbi:MAG: DUF4111 domain-containing protein [Bacillota bacterium]|nr:DUF4111 domain-containing protein [Bacillota bacterium]
MTLNEAIKVMTGEISSILADNKPTIYLFGSVTHGDFHLGWSDIDILVLNEREMTELQADMLVGLRQALLDRYPGNPYFRLFEGGMLSADAFLNSKNELTVYWGTSGQRITDNYKMDSFSMAELLDSGILLHGNDVRERMTYPTYAQMREDIIQHAQAARKYGTVVGWLLDIARGIYTLRTGKIIAKTAAGEWTLAERLCPDEDAMKKAVSVRKEPLRYSNEDKSVDNAVIKRFADVLDNELNHPYYYHGTTTPGITELKANPIVYLTPNRAYALFYIVDKNVNWVTCGIKDNDGKVHYDERFPNQLEKLYNGKSGYLYRCNDAEGLILGKSRDIVVSQSPVSVAGYEFIPDVFHEILNYEKAGAVVVKRYKNLTDTEKKDIFDMMLYYIYKLDLLAEKGTKADFIRESFPDAWAYAAAHIEDKSLIMSEWKKRRGAAK